jgi:succinylglutamate desuccinylase
MQSVLQDLLNRFKRRSKPGPWAYPWSYHFDGGKHAFHAVFGVMVHGDEVGSLPAAVRLITALADGTIPYGGRVTVFIGNPEAGLEDRRFLEADLNRVFLAGAGDSHEAIRAREIMPILDDADLFVDFHQTILSTERPFYIFPWQPVGWRWARTLRAADVWVTRNPGQAFSAGTRCADEYVRMRGKPGITIELSKKGFDPAAEQRAWEAMLCTLRTADLIYTKDATLAECALQHPDLLFFHTVHREAFRSADLALRQGLTNFRSVREGELLSSADSAELFAPLGGNLLFPKYPNRASGRAVDPIPKEIYRVIRPLTDHPMTLWGDHGEPPPR